MRRRGTGAIGRCATGWRVQVWVDGRRRSLGVHGTRDEAEAIREAALAGLAGVEHAGGAALGVWGARVLDRRELQGLRGVDRERSRWATHVEPDELADLPVHAIRRGDVQRWLDRRLVARVQGTKGRTWPDPDAAA